MLSRPSPQKSIILRSYLPMLALLMIFQTTAASAQRTSRSGQITLIARVPETVGMRVSAEDILNGGTFDAGKQNVANNVTAAWCLARGRSRMVTVVRLKQPNSPILIALAVPGGINNVLNTVSDVPLSFGLSNSSQKVHEMQLTAENITDANRIKESTFSLSDSIPDSQVAENGYTGVLKIQIQAVP